VNFGDSTSFPRLAVAASRSGAAGQDCTSVAWRETKGAAKAPNRRRNINANVLVRSANAKVRTPKDRSGRARSLGPQSTALFLACSSTAQALAAISGRHGFTPNLALRKMSDGPPPQSPRQLRSARSRKRRLSA
jgi:hypothetical protein